MAQTVDKKQIPLGVLASDHAGYLSFDLSHLIDMDQYERILVYPEGNEDNVHIDAKSAIEATQDLAVVTLNIKGPAMNSHSNLPSFQNPTVSDYRISPDSFAANPVGRLGNGGCENLLPRNFAEHEFLFRQLVIGTGRAEQIEKDPSEEDEEDLQPLYVRTGRIFEYKISWFPFGHSLGRLVYSLPLAPCESANLAVIEWARKDEAIRNEDLTVREQLLHNQMRDRTIEETVNASLQEWQRGGSVLGGLAGTYNGGQYAISGAVGGAYATSSGDRNLAATTVQRITDNIAQASSTVRNLYSTIVVQSSQAERDDIQTRTVTNHNHCHAMTVLYYEVLRHYRVLAEIVSWQDALLIKSPIIDFDEDNILRYRLVLEQAAKMEDS